MRVDVRALDNIGLGHGDGVFWAIYRGHGMLSCALRALRFRAFARGLQAMVLPISTLKATPRSRGIEQEIPLATDRRCAACNALVSVI